MATSKTFYEYEDDGTGFFKVHFIVNETGVRLTRTFDSPYWANKFVHRLRHSKRCTLISRENF